jgi:hypothetical protein
MKYLALALTWSLLAAAFIHPLLASGSYGARPPRPPAGQPAAKLDREKYELGKKVFSGKSMSRPDANVTAASQSARLGALQARLPKSTAKHTDLTALAGKLSATDLDALEYYVHERYK